MAALLQAEVLYALLGYTGQVVVRFEDGSFGLADGLALDPCERKLVLGMLPLGACYASLDDFLYTQLFDWRAASASAGGRDPQVLALAAGLEECLAPYRTRVLELEQQLLRGALPLTELQLGLSDLALTLPLLRSVVERVQAGGTGAAPLLDLLSETAASAVGSGRECVQVLLWHVQRVFLSQLASWLLHGELLPAASSSFFIQRVASAERAAEPSGAAHLSASAAPDPREEGLRPGFQEEGLGRGSREEVRGPGSREEGWGATRREEGWGEFETAGPLKPRLLPMRVAERALFIGKAVRVLRAAEESAEPRGRDSQSGGPKQRHKHGAASPPPPMSFNLAGGGTRPSACGTAAAADESGGVAGCEAGAAWREAGRAGCEAGAAGCEAGEAGCEAGRAGHAAGSGDTQQVRAALDPFADELASLRAARRLASDVEIDEIVGRMARVASRLLWRHLTHECGLAGLLGALKGYFLLGRGELFHRLVLELRTPMASFPTSRLDL